MAERITAKSTLAGKIISILFVLTVVPITIYGFWHLHYNNTVVSDEIDGSVIVPYTKAVQEHRYADAYNEYTSNTFKTKYSLADFEAAQAKNIAHYGEITEIQKRTRGISEVSPAGSSSPIFQATRLYVATNQTRAVVYEVEKEGNGFKLRHTYQITGTGTKILAHQIF